MNLATETAKAVEAFILNHYEEMRSGSIQKKDGEKIRATIHFGATLLDTSNPEDPAYKLDLHFSYTQKKVTNKISREYDPRHTDFFQSDPKPKHLTAKATASKLIAESKAKTPKKKKSS